MSWLHGARARFRLLFSRRSTERRIDEEIEFHIAMETERLIASGMTADDARRRALATFGGVENHRESLRDGRGASWMRGLGLDLKLGARMLAKYPGLTIIGVFGMSVAVAISTLVFSAVATMTTTSLPFDEGDRIVAITNIDTRSGNEARRTHLHDLGVWRDQLTTTKDLGLYRTVDRNFISTGGAPRAVRVAEMTATAFAIPRVTPVIGRPFTAADERVDSPPVVIIGHDLWIERFAGRLDAVGATIRLGATPHTVVGVMPKGFAFPINNQVWIPLRLNPAAYDVGDAPAAYVIARLREGYSLEDAHGQLKTIGRRLALELPATHRLVRPRIVPYTRSFLDSPGMAWLLHLGQVIITLLLVVIGTNVAVLVYARTASRGGELAVRTALGASRSRIVMQLFAEALVLSSLASVVGLLIARSVFTALEALVRQSADDQIPFWIHLRITPGVAIYTAGLAILAAVIVGVVPALKATRAGVHLNLKELGGNSIKLGRTWTILLVAQVAVSVAALPLAMMGLKYWVALGGLDLGFSSPRDVLVSTPRMELDAVVLPSTEDVDKLRSDRYAPAMIELKRRLEQDPAIAGVLFSVTQPGKERDERFEVEHQPGDRPQPVNHTNFDSVAAESNPNLFGRLAGVDVNYFPFHGVRPSTGRDFTRGDFAPSAPSVIVDEAFVRRFFGPVNPIGRRVRTAETNRDRRDHREAGPWWQIVGVVKNLPATVDLDAAVPMVYRPMDVSLAQPLVMSVRARGSSNAIVAERIRQTAVSVDPAIRFGPIRTLEEVLDDDVRINRLSMLALIAVAGSVTILSMAGIYALMSFTVERRRREIGIRSALGAGRWRVLSGVLRSAIRQIALGILIGTTIFGLLMRPLGIDEPPLEALWILVRMAALMAAAGIVATIAPARRALRVQPTEVLKSE